MAGKNRILLFYPRFNTEKGGRSSATSIFLPLSLLYVANPLLEGGFDVTILDGRLEDYRPKVLELKDELLACGVSCQIPQIKHGLEFSRFVKSLDENIPIAWGGWYPTTHPEQTIADPAIDFVVKGEGEVTFSELCARLRDGESVQDLQGIVYMKQGEMASSPDRPLLKEYPSKRLPYELLKMEAYHIANGTINYVSSRGCPHNCRFCSIHGYTRQWKGLKAEQIVSDLAFLKSEFGVHSVIFHDDNFCANPKRVREFVHLLAEARLEITWMCNSHVRELSFLDQETFDMCRQSGLSRMSIGVESGSQKTLDFIRKAYKVKELAPVLERIHKASIPLRTFFIIGFPDESEADLEETFSLMKHVAETYPDSELIMRLYHPIPGTDLYDYEKQSEIPIRFPETIDEMSEIELDVGHPWDPESSHLMSYRDREFLRKKSFYFWLAYISPSVKNRRKAGRFKMMFELLSRAARFRSEKNFFSLPVEWWNYRLLQALRGKHSRN